MSVFNIQGGPKVGIQYTIYYILYTYFWPTLYNCNVPVNQCEAHTSLPTVQKQPALSTTRVTPAPAEVPI